MHLFELFSEPSQLQTVTANNEEVVQRAKLSDGTYIDLTYYNLGKDRWKFSFSRKTATPGIGNKLRSAFGREPKLSDGSYGKTGQGNANEVFSTVAASLKQFLTQYTPFQFIFTADKGDTGMDTSRTSLYQAMVRRLFPASQYDVQVEDTVGFDQFTITRKDNVPQ